MYPSGMPLGPHEFDFEEVSEHPSRASRFYAATREAFSRLHHVSSALILIALLSFAANIAFSYITFVRQGISPDVTEIGLGSDDNRMDGPPPIFTPSVHFKLVDNPAQIKMSAESYLVADAETGEIILEKNADTQYPIASVSKLMTAIVAREHIDPRHSAQVSGDSLNAYGTEGNLYAGEKILVYDLYYPLLMESSNDAAEVLADDFGRVDFLKLLNDKASSLTMLSTIYEDPSGLSPQNVSTSHDLAKLGLYVYRSYPELLDITRVKQYAILGHTWINKNMFLTYPNFLGGKNGFINESKQTTLSYFQVFFRGTDPASKAVSRPVLLVLLKSGDRDKDAAALLSYVTKNINYVEQNQN